MPKGSGLAFNEFTIFEFNNDTLYKFDQRRIISTNVPTNDFENDTLEVFFLGKERTAELKELIINCDSLGDHHARGCLIQYGWPRFFISTHLNGEFMSGFLTNCYRAHIFQFIDFLNDCYPNGKVIDYTIEELVRTEKECEEYNYGSKK